MGKYEIIKHYETFNQWLVDLKKLKDEDWYRPIAKGKWSVGAIIAHLLLWDEYSLRERFPFMTEGNKLEPFPNFQIINDQADDYAKKHSKDELIDQLVALRKKHFIEKLKLVDDTYLQISFSIGDHKLKILDYLNDFIYHDLHHKKQIDSFVNLLYEFE